MKIFTLLYAKVTPTFILFRLLSENKPLQITESEIIPYTYLYF